MLNTFRLLLEQPGTLAEYFHDVGPNFLVMELLDGTTLAQEIRKGPIAPSLVSHYGAQIAAALADAQGEGIVHRDLKPGNIMLTRHGVKVLDFGLARMASQKGLTETNVIMGTPAYMAPEQLKGREADGRTDLFELGLMLYEMAAGRLPFPGASLGVRKCRPAARRFRSNHPASLGRSLRRA